MAQFEKHFVQDLTQDIKIRQCGTIVFNGDNLSNVITVDLYNGTEPYSGGGSVSCSVICPDGATVPITNGSISGNTVTVTLTGDCFALPGQIGVGVQVVSGDIRTTILKAIYNVELLETDTIVDPGSRITASVGQLVSDIENAVAQIPASDMASLMAGIAPTFSASTNYTAGAYVYYNGTLYRFTTAHAAGSWTGTDATAVALGNDLGGQISDLKSAFNRLDNTVTKQTTIKRIASGGTAQGGVEMTDAAYIDTNGVRQASSGYRNSGYVEIEAWATIDLFMYGLSSFCAVAFYDENKNFISGIIPSGSGWQRISGVQTIPNNAKYYIVTLMNADASGYAICTDAKRISTEQVAELKEYADERFEEIIDPVKVMVSDISGEGVQNGFIDSSGNYNSTGSWVVTGYIRTDALETIIDHVNVFATTPVVAFYDEYKVFLATSTSQTTGVQDFSVVVPAEAYYMRLNYYKADLTQYYSYNVLKMRANALYINQLNDVLYGKKLGAIGDSITIGTYSVPGMTYVNQIANAHNMTVDNQAIWGSVFPTEKTQGDNPRGSIYSQVASLSADCDMVIISGGINDADYQADDTYWGNVSGGYDATLDTTTFCGAFEGTLKAALDKFKGKPILFVFEHRMTQKYQSQYGQHFEDVQYPLMIEMLNKWGVPYVDLFHDMPSIKLTPGYIALYSFDDQGVHPNIAGYRKFYVPRVESALKAIAS